MKPKNARFWNWTTAGWVKLTLRPGQSLSFGHWGRHEEGWSSSAETFSHTGDGVQCEIDTDGVDCDGRLSTSRAFFCPLADLAANEPGGDPCPENEGIRTPLWQKQSASQRDYSAERAGY